MSPEVRNDLTIARKVYFSCGWNELEVQGYGSGHNICLEAFVCGKEQGSTGLIINLKDLDAELKKLVKELDHKHLNYDIPELKAKVLSDKRVIVYCFKKLKLSLKKWSHINLICLKLYKSNDCSVELLADGYYI